MKKDLIAIRDLSKKEIEGLFVLAEKVKKDPRKFSSALSKKSLALIFEKPSNRTYVSFQVGMFELGGNSIYLGPEHIKLGVRETIHDVAKTLSRYVDGIVLRTFSHQNVLDMARYASVPVINGLSDLLHPCQGLTDIFTIKEKRKDLSKVTLAYLGDGNNVCHSLLYACSKMGMHFNIATPLEYSPSQEVVDQSLAFAKVSGSKIRLFNDPFKAVEGSDVVYTDVWTSMGQENEAVKRCRDLKDFQLNRKLISRAKKDCLVMHCLPAHRGEEITDEVIDGVNSVVFDQAENRLHVQKAILMTLLR